MMEASDQNPFAETTGMRVWLCLPIILVAGACAALCAAQTPTPFAFPAQTTSNGLPAGGTTAPQARPDILYVLHACKQYAWGHDALRPLRRGYAHSDARPLHVIPRD